MLLSAVLKQVPTLVVERIELASDEFTDLDQATAWVAEHGFDVAEAAVTDAGYSFPQRDQAEFLDGSLRSIGSIDSGVSATVGIPVVQLKVAKGDTPEIDISDLHHLEDLEIHEVTLTRSPAVGAMAEFRLIKSLSRSAETPPIQKRFEIAKVDAARREIWGYALVPDLPDLQGDIVSAETIRNASASFLKSAFLDRSQKGSGIGEEHEVFDGIGYPIDSLYDEPGVFGVACGWWLGVKVLDEEVWKAVESGEIKGFSIGGTGIREPVGELALKSQQLLAIELSKAEFTREQAQDWIAKHEYRGGAMLETRSTYRFEQGSPEDIWACGKLGLTAGVTARVGLSKQRISKAFQVGADADLPIEDADWNGDEAKSRVFAWAGFDDDDPDPAMARRAFLAYDDSEPELRGSYKLPFADVVGGELVAITGGLRAAASRLPQTDIPEDVQEQARAVLDDYFERIEEMSKNVRKGDQLAAFLSKKIEELATDDRSRGDIVASMAEAASIEADAVNQILSGEVVRPPDGRLEGFAKALDLSVDHLKELADADAGVEKALTVDELHFKVLKVLEVLHPSSWPWIVALFFDRVIYEIEPFELLMRTVAVSEDDQVQLGEALAVTAEYVAAEKKIKKGLIHEGGARPEKSRRKSLGRRVAEFVGGIFGNHKEQSEEIEMDTKELEKRLAGHKEEVAKAVADEIGALLAKQLPASFPTKILEAGIGEGRTENSQGSKILSIVEQANKMLAEDETQFSEENAGEALGFVLEGLQEGHEQLAKAVQQVAEAVKSIAERKPMRKGLDLEVSALLGPGKMGKEEQVNKSTEDEEPSKPFYHPLYGYGHCLNKK